MKKFEEPKLNVEELEVEDIVTTSPDGCDADNPDCSWQGECFND